MPFSSEMILICDGCCGKVNFGDVSIDEATDKARHLGYIVESVEYSLSKTRVFCNSSCKEKYLDRSSKK